MEDQIPEVFVVQDEEHDNKYLSYCWEPKIALYGDTPEDAKEKVYNLLADIDLNDPDFDSFIIPSKEELGEMVSSKLVEIICKFTGHSVEEFLTEIEDQ
jgi:hypothetical protein